MVMWEALEPPLYGPRLALVFSLFVGDGQNTCMKVHRV